MDWIINSLLDSDFYKFTMGQVIFKYYKNIPVTMGFKNRTTSIDLPDFISLNELRQQLDHVKGLKLTKTELHYLRGTNEYQERMFSEDYLQALQNINLSDYFCDVTTYSEPKNKLILDFSGAWHDTTYWEIYALAIVNEMYFRSLLKNKSSFKLDAIRAEGIKRLEQKITELRKYPELTFTDFGTRRRFSREWQEYVVKTMAEELPDQFIGTSNVKLAEKYGLLPMGTSAHEPEMVLAGLAGNLSDKYLHDAPGTWLQKWWQQYDWGLSIALTDTFGTDFFFQNFTKEQANNWKGLRQDSGDPIQFGERAIQFYENYDIDPKEKLLIFSDGLDVKTMIKIFNHFHKRIKVTFGWGTNLTNDLGLAPLSLVIKATKADGKPLVKLSDNLAKAIGPKDEVERYKRVFGYTNSFSEKCTY